MLDITLPQPLTDFVKAQAAAQGYDDERAYLVALVEREMQQIEQLRALIKEGDESGYRPLDMEALMKRVEARKGLSG